MQLGRIRPSKSFADCIVVFNYRLYLYGHTSSKRFKVAFNSLILVLATSSISFEIFRLWHSNSVINDSTSFSIDEFTFLWSFSGPCPWGPCPWSPCPWSPGPWSPGFQEMTHSFRVNILNIQFHSFFLFIQRRTKNSNRIRNFVQEIFLHMSFENIIDAMIIRMTFSMF